MTYACPQLRASCIKPTKTKPNTRSPKTACIRLGNIKTFYMCSPRSLCFLSYKYRQFLYFCLNLFTIPHLGTGEKVYLCLTPHACYISIIYAHPYNPSPIELVRLYNSWMLKYQTIAKVSSWFKSIASGELELLWLYLGFRPTLQKLRSLPTA